MVDVGRIVHNSVYLLGAQAPIQAISAIYAIFLARWLGREAFGVYTAIWAILLVFAALAEEGLALSITRDVARAPSLASSRLSTGLVVALALGIAASGSMVAFAWLLGYPSWVVALAALAASSLWLHTTRVVLAGGLNAFQKIGASSALTIADGAIKATIGVTLVMAGWELVGALTAAVVAEATTLGLAVWLARRELPPIAPRFVSRAEAGRLLSAWLPFSVRTVLTLAYLRADAILLSVIAGFEAVGLYRAAYKAIELALLLPVALTQALFPVLSALHASSRDRLRVAFERYSAYLAMIALPLAALLAWLARPLILAFYGAEYERSAPILPILAITMVLLYVNAPLRAVAISGDDQARATAISMVVAAASVGLQLVLIPRLGTSGAALATIGAELVTFALFGAMVRAYLGPTAVPRNLARILAAGLVSVGLAVLLSQISPWLAPLALPLYVALLLGFRALLPRDWRLLMRASRDLLPGRPRTRGA